MTYNGIGMHQSLENGRKSGHIKITREAITFSYEGGAITFPMAGIEISAGGAGNRIIYFRHHQHPEWCFYSGDKEIAKDEFLLKSDSGKRSASQVKSSNRVLVVLGVSFLLLIVAIAGTIFLLREKIVYSIAQTIPVEWEQEAGESIFESIKEEKPLVKDSLLNAQVNQLGSIVTKSVDDTTFKFKFYIVEDTTLNAFALPGGNVVIHSALLLQAENAEEVLGVLGHEIAHVTQRHHARGLINNLGISMIIKTFLGVDSDLGNLIIDAGGTLQSLKYSRDLETEADDKGWDYLVKANINPNGMISFFKKLEKESNPSGETSEQDLSFLSTHPATGNRIKDLQKKLDKTLEKRSFTAVNFDFKGFQESLKKKVSK